MRTARKGFLELQAKQKDTKALGVNKHILSYMERVRNTTLDSGEVYQEMVEKGYLLPCPTTITSSSMGAIFNALRGEIETANSCCHYASILNSGNGDPVLRVQWIQQEVLRLTGIELSC